MRFRNRPLEVEVIQWFKPGDHPDECKCGISGLGHSHLIEDLMHPLAVGVGTLHPGDFVLTHADGTHEVLSQAELNERFEPVPIAHGVAYHHT
jgi:hypothetical protein